MFFLRRFLKRALLGVALLGSLAPLSSQTWEVEESSRLMGSDRTVTVSSGQSLYEIARAQGYALEHLAEANGLPVSLEPVPKAKVLVPSRRLLPLERPENGLVVNLTETGFYLFRKGRAPQFFPIAVGEPGRFQTPTGRFAIREKVVDPEWIAPEWAGLGENNVIPAGPDNPLGDRWIGLTSSGLGMHSTNNPSSIGSATSHGCMRMYPEVARTVFDLVEVGWPVTIEYETSRVSLEKTGIYAVSFPDPYGRANRAEQLKEKFRELDLIGFHGLLDISGFLRESTGVVTRLVDLEPRARLSDGKNFPAALIGKKVYLEGSALRALGIKQEFKLADRSVVLSRGEKQIRLPLRFSEESSALNQAFLSRGGAWYPAKEVLAPFKVAYQWDAAGKRLKIDQKSSDEAGDTDSKSLPAESQP